MIAAIVDPRNCGLERAEVLFYAHTQFQRVFALTVECWWTCDRDCGVSHTTHRCGYIVVRVVVHPCILVSHS